MATLSINGDASVSAAGEGRSAGLHVSIVRWDHNGIGDALRDELAALGHRTSFFDSEGAIPRDADIVLLYGPYGLYLPVLAALQRRPEAERPTTVIWTTEGFPDLRTPDWLLRATSAARSFTEFQLRPGRPTDASFLPGLHRLRYMGDLEYAYARGWLDVLADISDVYAQRYRRRGLPVEHIPFGSFPAAYEDLGLERDIDVLWMGKRATRRRSRMLDQLETELTRRGIRMHVVDGVRHPFVFKEDRTSLLNRSKITLNLLRTWYDENSMRFFMAAPNRSLYLSEELLPHVPQIRPGVDYVYGKAERLPDLIEHYLTHEAERKAVVDRAYNVATGRLTLGRSVERLVEAAVEVKERRR